MRRVPDRQVLGMVLQWRAANIFVLLLRYHRIFFVRIWPFAGFKTDPSCSVALCLGVWEPVSWVDGLEDAFVLALQFGKDLLNENNAAICAVYITLSGGNSYKNASNVYLKTYTIPKVYQMTCPGTLTKCLFIRKNLSIYLSIYLPI